MRLTQLRRGQLRRGRPPAGRRGRSSAGSRCRRPPGGNVYWHTQASRNECKRSKNAEDPDRERTKKNLAATKRLADPFADNDRKRQRQGHNYKDSDWRAAGYDTYEDYMYDRARGLFCDGQCKD